MPGELLYLGENFYIFYIFLGKGRNTAAKHCLTGELLDQLL